MDFSKLPYNTQRAYVSAVSEDGCKIYIPVMTRDELYMKLKRDQLKTFLNNQEIPKDYA